MTTSLVREKKIKTNGIWLNVAEKGDEGRPLVLLLHGFPETWFSWRHQIDYLSSHGYHVVAPDLRGYGDSEFLPSHESYTVSHLVADVIGLLDHYGTAQAFVAGHDWGSVIGWSLCLFRPDRVKGFISLSVPYSPRDPNLKPSEFSKTFGDGLYITQFQVTFKILLCFVLFILSSFDSVSCFTRNLEELKLHLPSMIARRLWRSSC